MEHFIKVGSHLSNAVKAYNSTVNSYESRVLRQGRRLDELKVAETLAKRRSLNPRRLRNRSRVESKARVDDQRSLGFACTLHSLCILSTTGRCSSLTHKARAPTGPLKDEPTDVELRFPTVTEVEQLGIDFEEKGRTCLLTI